MRPIGRGRQARVHRIKLCDVIEACPFISKLFAGAYDKSTDIRAIKSIRLYWEHREIARTDSATQGSGGDPLDTSRFYVHENLSHPMQPWVMGKDGTM